MKKFDKREPIVIPPRKVVPLKPRPVKCGACGMVFEIGKPICYTCVKPECPIFLRIHMSTEWHGGSYGRKTMTGTG